MDLCKWMRMFNLEPTLKPDGLEYESGVWHVSEYPLRDDQLVIAAALIRDRAVWWLDDKWLRLDKVIGSEGDSYQLMGTALNTRKFWCKSGTSLSSDRTTALYLACCRVIGVDP